jgi:hypothetical protein
MRVMVEIETVYMDLLDAVGKTTKKISALKLYV